MDRLLLMVLWEFFPALSRCPPDLFFPPVLSGLRRRTAMQSASRNHEEGPALPAEIQTVLPFLWEEICPMITGADPIISTSGEKPGTVTGTPDTRNDRMTLPFVLNYPRINNSGDILWT